MHPPSAICGPNAVSEEDYRHAAGATGRKKSKSLLGQTLAQSFGYVSVFTSVTACGPHRRRARGHRRHLSSAEPHSPLNYDL